jgi:hypothetical protein
MAVKTPTYAGANIANSVLGGIKIPPTGTGSSGGAAPVAVPVNQPAIGAYVQDALFPAADTNYLGLNPRLAYPTNVLGESNTVPFETSAVQPNWISPADDNAATGGVAQWVKNGITALIPGDKVDIAAGIATKNIATGTHNVFANVPANYFFWAVAVA